MQRILKIFQPLVLLLILMNACTPKTVTPLPLIESPTSTNSSPTATITPTLPATFPTSTYFLTATPAATLQINDYGLCGDGDLIQVPYFFTDVNGTISPTQLIRRYWTDDAVRYSVKLTTCLKYDEGWTSNLEEVESGYENVIIFFDKFGKAHDYRIIIGGHYINPYNPKQKDITITLNEVDKRFITVEDWIRTTREHFNSTGVRQIGVDIYIEDILGNQSKVLDQVYQFRDINNQIEEALKSGEGYPENVPEEFFLFATESWLIKSE